MTLLIRASCKTPISAQIRPFAATPGPGADCLCPVGYANLRRARAGAKIIGFVQESGFCNWLYSLKVLGVAQMLATTMRPMFEQYSRGVVVLQVSRYNGLENVAVISLRRLNSRGGDRRPEPDDWMKH